MNRIEMVNVKPCDENIKKTLELVKDMLNIAEKVDADREDDGCGILYGVMLDSAYKIKQIAEVEKEKHIKKGGGNRAVFSYFELWYQKHIVKILAAYDSCFDCKVSHSTGSKFNLRFIASKDYCM